MHAAAAVERAQNLIWLLLAKKKRGSNFGMFPCIDKRITHLLIHVLQTKIQAAPSLFYGSKIIGAYGAYNRFRPPIFLGDT